MISSPGRSATCSPRAQAYSLPPSATPTPSGAPPRLGGALSVGTPIMHWVADRKGATPVLITTPRRRTSMASIDGPRAAMSAHAASGGGRRIET